jgi:hypothetical protein
MVKRGKMVTRRLGDARAAHTRRQQSRRHSRHPTERQLDRRAFLLTTVAGLAGTRLLQGQSAVTRPVVSERDCPLETIYPVAADGHHGLAVLRKPPGPGPFPAVVWFHGGLTTFPLARLQGRVRDLATGPRFPAAGYVSVDDYVWCRPRRLWYLPPAASMLAF